MSAIVRSVALAVVVAGVGVATSLATSAALGMGASETAHLASLLVPAGVVTVLAAVAAPRLLTTAPLSSRLATVAIVAVVAAFANLAALAFGMIVGDHDAKILAILLIFALGVGLAVAITLARPTTAALTRLGRAAETLGRGDLAARVGPLGAGAEIDALGRTLDDMAEQLQRLHGREREVEAMRRDLITAVSHDLRTPLASLRAMVEAIDDGVVSDPPSLRRYVAKMKEAVTQLSTLIDDLFEFAQLEAGAIEVETQRVGLDDIVRTVLATVEPHAARKRLALRTDLAEAAGMTCSPRMRRVLQNLVMNAVRHTPADGAVRVSARRHGDRIELAVEDSGEGMPTEVLERVFEPFYRVDPARSGAGAGLGLALAKRIVEALGGRISAGIAAGGGARFEILLPLG